MMHIFWLMLFIHNVLAIKNVITIDQSGSDTLECCVDGKCPCSSLSLAFIHIEDNTEISVTSDISLHHDVEFGNISSIIIIGYNNPAIMCDHQGGLVGNYIKQITIQNITWDKCNGIIMYGFTDAYITDCTFQYSTNFALTLKGIGSIHINGNSFFHNNGGVDALAPSIFVYNSNLYDTIKYEALHINTTTDVSVTIIGCTFTNNSGYGVNFIGNWSTPKLLISSCTFTNNTNSSVVGDNVDITWLHNVTFYNNVVVNASGELSEDGAAIRVYNSTVSVNGTVMFCNNIAGNNGGAVYLLYSTILAQQGTVTFYNNTADNGGAVYIGEGSKLYTSKTVLRFLNNTALLFGGALYIDHFTVDDMYDWDFYSYYKMMNGPNHFVSNTANTMENNMYFYLSFIDCGALDFTTSLLYYNKKTLSSSVCCIIPSPQSNVAVNSTNFTCITKEGKTDCQVDFTLQDIYLNFTFVDCFHNHISPINHSCSIGCADTPSTYNCIINRTSNSVIISNDTAVKCSFNRGNEIHFTYSTSNDHGHDLSSDIFIAVHWNKYLDNCINDIAHIASPGLGCLPLSCDLLHYVHKMPKGFVCLHDQYDPGEYSIVPGYWYSNGFSQYVPSCPPGLCDNYFDINFVIEFQKVLPDSNSQCHEHWIGLACGECNDSILYDTTKCVYSKKCLSKSLAFNLLLLLFISFLYWCFVIAFIFVMLHFKFDVTAGYAYGAVFYYSVLEAFANMFYAYNHPDAEICDAGTAMQVLSFFTIVGNLKPPFLRYLGLCLHKTEVIDHMYITYIHALIVTSLITVIFVTARKYVVVARYIGRYINSKSICLLLLLSYNSVCYTSVQLLKPLAVYNENNNALKWHTYLSPTMQYFHGRHILYGIIAILCELIIGIGLPLAILTQRYLIRYFNLKLISIKPVIDQLQGCYKEEYRWFAAYYLICRQVIYAMDITMQFLSVKPSSIILIACILIFAIHLWFQPYKAKSLNFFDAVILLIMILASFSGFYRNGLCTGAVMGYSILPLLCLVNYLALSTKLKHILIPISCGGMICITMLFVWDLFLYISLLTLCSVLFLAYILFVVKSCYVTRRKRLTKYVMIDEQKFDDINEDSDGESDAP